MTSVTKWGLIKDWLKRGGALLFVWFVPVWWGVITLQTIYQMWQGTKVDAVQLLAASAMIILQWVDNRLGTHRLRQQRDDYRNALEARDMLLTSNNDGVLHSLVAGDTLDCQSNRFPGMSVKIKAHSACTLEVL